MNLYFLHCIHGTIVTINPSALVYSASLFPTFDVSSNCSWVRVIKLMRQKKEDTIESAKSAANALKRRCELSSEFPIASLPSHFAVQYWYCILPTNFSSDRVFHGWGAGAKKQDAESSTGGNWTDEDWVAWWDEQAWQCTKQNYEYNQCVLYLVSFLFPLLDSSLLAGLVMQSSWDQLDLLLKSLGWNAGT